jgi:hypothetical protein
MLTLPWSTAAAAAVSDHYLVSNNSKNTRYLLVVLLLLLLLLLPSKGPARCFADTSFRVTPALYDRTGQQCTMQHSVMSSTDKVLVVPDTYRAGSLSAAWLVGALLNCSNPATPYLLAAVSSVLAGTVGIQRADAYGAGRGIQLQQGNPRIHTQGCIPQSRLSGLASFSCRN